VPLTVGRFVFLSLEWFYLLSLLRLTRLAFVATSVSMWRKVIPGYLAALHYKSNSLQLGNVSNRISSDGNEISKFPGLNRADAILPAQHFRGVGRNGTNHVEGGHPGFMQSRKS